MEEIWKPVGIKNYQVSNLGRVRGQDGIRILKPQTNKHGYFTITIRFDNNKKTYTIHYLVMLSFIGERPDGMEIDHINRIRNDNRLENLRYCSRSENQINTCRYRNDISETNCAKRKYLIAKDYLSDYRESHREIHKAYMKQYYALKKQAIQNK